MSAYMVAREHVQYLVDAAMSYRLFGHDHTVMQWHHGGKSHTLTSTDFATASKVGQMLWDENRLSIEQRYPDSREDFVANAPGPVGEEFVYGQHRRMPGEPFDPVQVIKSCHCYEYQACEHPGWGESEAKAFVDKLAKSATNALPGYEDAEWGPPKSVYARV